MLLDLKAIREQPVLLGQKVIRVQLEQLARKALREPLVLSELLVNRALQALPGQRVMLEQLAQLGRPARLGQLALLGQMAPPVPVQPLSLFPLVITHLHYPLLELPAACFTSVTTPGVRSRLTGQALIR